MSNTSPDSSDATLVKYSLAGDQAAFGRLVRRHRAGVTRLLQATFGNLAGVEDLVQESFLRAYLDLGRLRDPGSFGAWVRSIAVNLARMELRAGRLSLISWESIRPYLRATRSSPESLTERRELVHRIRGAIAALPPAEREAITHVYLNELSHREAAEQLNTSVGAIKVRVHRGRKRLRQRLRLEFPGKEEQMEAGMIAVRVYDVLAKLPEEERLEQVDETRPAVEQAEDWLVRLSVGGHRVVLLAEKEGDRLLPVWVGPTEAEGIILQIQGRSPLRPITFDLMKDILAVGNMQLQRAAISRLHEKVYYGTLIVKQNRDDVQELDCRPSDALNLALRMDAPIFVAPEIMAQQGVREEPGAYDYLPCESGERWVSLLQG